MRVDSCAGAVAHGGVVEWKSAKELFNQMEVLK
jgi:hypothetical protein